MKRPGDLDSQAFDLGLGNSFFGICFRVSVFTFSSTELLYQRTPVKVALPDSFDGCEERIAAADLVFQVWQRVRFVRFDSKREPKPECRDLRRESVEVNTVNVVLDDVTFPMVLRVLGN